MLQSTSCATRAIAVSLWVVLLISSIHGYDNGLARTPPMGFNSWNQFGCKINESVIIQTIDSMVKSGLRDIGYRYVNIDDCWATMDRDPKTFRMVPDPVRFPSGIQGLAKYAHSQGMLLGIYSDVGLKTCQGYPGSYNYYEIDADTFAEWGIDYLKFDYCHSTDEQKEAPWNDYYRMSKALNSTGRPIVYSICNWGVKAPWEWAPKMANSWRTTGDIAANWNTVMTLLDANRDLYKYSAPGSWNDPDMLEVGVKTSAGQLTPMESMAHFSLWSLVNSPLLLGNDLRDLRSMEPWVFDIITNRDVIAVNQDALGKQGYMAAESLKGVNVTSGECLLNKSNSCVRTEVWVKQLSNDAFAVILFNRAGKEENDPYFGIAKVELSWKDHLKVPSQKEFYVKDLWARRYLGIVKDSLSIAVAPHGITMYHMTPIA